MKTVDIKARAESDALRPLGLAGTSLTCYLSQDLKDSGILKMGTKGQSRFILYQFLLYDLRALTFLLFLIIPNQKPRSS